MPTLTFHTGWEHGTVGPFAGSSIGDGLTFYQQNDITVSSAAARTGTYSLRAASAAGAVAAWVSARSATGRLVYRVWFRIDTLPTAGNKTNFAWSENTVPDRAYIAVDENGTLYARINAGTEQTGPTIETGKWNELDLDWEFSTASHTLDWRINGVGQTQATVTATAGAAATSSVVLGVEDKAGGSSTGVVYFDDLLVSSTQADYPLPDHVIYGITVDQAAAAEHQSITTTDWQTTPDYAAFTNFTGASETTSRGYLNDLDTADGIRINRTTAPAGNARWKLAVHPQAPPTDPSAVRFITAVREAATGTNNAIIRVLLAGSTANIFSGNPAWGTTWNYLPLYRTTTPAGGAWVNSDVDALRFELDSTDASPNIWVSGIYAEVAYPSPIPSLVMPAYRPT